LNGEKEIILNIGL